VKLRIEGNNVRLRLSEDEVARFARGEPVVEQTTFAGGDLRYRLDSGGEELTARFTSDAGIEVVLPQSQAKAWAEGAEVSVRGSVEVEGETLTVLVEKDLKRDRD
jgi:hypothetical protein